MITKLTISNFATIKCTSIEFTTGTTVITGETGAGKSIVIDALLCALGWKISPTLVGNHAESLTVSLHFTLPQHSTYLTNNHDGEQIIQRRISRDGKNKIFWNNKPISLSYLRQFSNSLVNVHGQHAQQELLRSDKQRELLDHFAHNTELCSHISALSKQYADLLERIAIADNNRTQNITLKQLISAQLEDLSAANLLTNEWQELTEENKKLSNAEYVSQQLCQTLNFLQNTENYNIRATLYKTIKLLNSISTISPQIQQWTESINTIAIELDNISKDIEDYLPTLENHSERLSKVTQRMAALHDLGRKYQISPENLHQYHQELVLKLENLTNTEDELEQLHLLQQQLRTNYINLATQLSDRRKIAANQLAQNITTIIQQLNLPHAELNIKVEPQDNSTTLSATGIDKISFFIKTNLGENSYPLAKIASGGELSRISLALHLVNAEQRTTPTIIFDEVDVGMGGETASLVGKLINKLGKTQQVLCITHLPQVAVYGDHHINVTKITHGNSTITNIKSLSQEARNQEIARMLGGVEITPTTLQHAKEMLNQAHSITVTN